VTSLESAWTLPTLAGRLRAPSFYVPLDFTGLIRSAEGEIGT
jgi:hypothetical protein